MDIIYVERMLRMSNNNNIVRIDNKRYSEIKMYAAFKGLKIVNIVNQAVDAYLNNSEEFIQFKQKFLLFEKEKNIIVAAKDYEKLIEIAEKNNIKLNN